MKREDVCGGVRTSNVSVDARLSNLRVEKGRGGNG